MLQDQSAEKILHSINQRQISIKEVMEYYLDRIEKLDFNDGLIIQTIIQILDVNIITMDFSDKNIYNNYANHN